MTAFTSSQAGNWSASSTWGGAGVPGIGDTASIGHDITVDVDTTVGTSGVLGTADVVFSVAKTLTIAAAVAFKCRSDLGLVGPTSGVFNSLVLNAGSKFYFDGSVSNVSYKIKMGAASNQIVRITATGVAGNRAQFISLGTAAGAFTQSGGTTGQCDFQYVMFVNVATSTFYGNSGTTPTQNFIFCDFDANCGIFRAGTMSATSSCRMENCVFRAASGSGFQYSAAFTSGATLTCKDNAFVGCQLTVLNWGNGPAFVERNAIAGATGINRNGTPTASATIIRNNAFWRSGVVDMAQDTDFTGNYYGWISTAAGNPHGIQYTAPSGTQNLTDNIIEYTNTATDGDMFTPGGPAAPVTYNIKRNLVLPNSAGNSPGTLCSFLGSVNIIANIEHNTAYISATDTGGVSIGETVPGFAGMVASHRSNLYWRSSSSAACLLSMFGAGPTTALTVTIHALNAKWNLTGADSELTAGTITTDSGNTVILAANPFVDSTRNIGKWDASLGGPGTGANAWTKICAKNDDSGYDTRYTEAALYAYIGDGFKVTDTSLNNAGHDGATIGALSFLSVGSPTGGRARRSGPILYYLTRGMIAAMTWLRDLVTPKGTLEVYTG